VGPTPNPQSPIPNPQSPIPIEKEPKNILIFYKFKLSVKIIKLKK